MNEKILDFYKKCMHHNIAITIKPCLSDACIELQGDCLAYNKKNNKYEHIRYTNRISIDNIKSSKIDILELHMNDMFLQLIEKRRELQGE